MESLYSAAHMVRKLGVLTVLGFLIVFLIGPVLTVLGVILPFALVGFLVWLPFRLFVQKREVNWSGLPRKSGQAIRTVLTLPLRIGGFMLSAVTGLVRLVFGAIGYALRIIIPAVAGAFLFAVLGAIGGVAHQDAEFRIPAAALIGAGLGALYGAFRTRSETKVVVLRATPATGNQT